LSLRLLGSFEVTLDGEPITEFGSDKARALLALLSIESARPFRRSELAGMFWPDLPEKRAAHALSQTLYRLRTALRETKRPASSTHPPFLLFKRQEIQFNSQSDHELDIALFTELRQQSRQHHHPMGQSCAVCIRWLHQAAELYQDDLLKGLFPRNCIDFEEWQRVQRENLHRQAVEILARIITYHEGRGELELVQRFSEQLVAIEAWHEQGYLALMRALVGSGQTAAALEKYAYYRRTLAEQFDLEPSKEAQALYQQIKSGQFQRALDGEPATGATLAGDIPQLDRGDRRHVSTLICGPWKLPGDADPEEYYEHFARCSERCPAIFEHYGGHRLQRQGTSCVVHFGYPVAHEDAARRAILAGLELAKVSEEYDTVHAIGIHSGDMVSVSGNLIGPVPDVAQACQHLAPTKGVWITVDTERLIHRWFDCQAVGSKSLSGRAAPVDVFRVLRANEASNHLDRLTQTRGLTSFVGREPELKRLFSFADLIRSGNGQVLLISGEPGIGKSRLLREFRARWEERYAIEAWTWLESRCSPDAQNSSLDPIIALLGQVLGIEDDDDPDVKRAKLNRTLERCDLAHSAARWFLSLMLGLPTDAPTPRTITADQRERMREIFIALLKNHSVRQPLIVTIEDLHWSDSSTVEWLGRSLDELAAVPCLLLLTHRPTFAPPLPQRENLHSIALGPLDADQAAALASSVMGEVALPEEVRQHIVQRSDGIPLFVEELAAAILSQRNSGGHENLLASQLPMTLRDLLLAHLDHVGSAKKTAQWAALLGREFSDTILSAVVPYDEQYLRDDLRRLSEADLVHIRGRSNRLNYAFKHALIRDAAYASMLHRDRQDRHRRIAETLESRFPQIVEEQPETLAHHFFNSGLQARAVEFWLRAGERATAQGLPMEAKNFFNLAIENAAPGDNERHWKALRGREKALDALGEREAQAADLNVLMELAEEFNDDRRRALIYLRQTGLATKLGDFRTAISLADATITSAGRAGDQEMELKALAQKVQAFTILRELSEVEEAVEKMLAQVDRVADDSVRSLALSVAAHYFVELGEFRRSAKLQADSIEAAGRAGDHSLEIGARANLGLVYSSLGLYEQARSMLETGLAQAEAFGSRRLQANIRMHLGHVLWQKDDPESAQEVLEQALHELKAVGDTYGEAACSGYMGGVLEDTGNLTGAAQCIALARETFTELGMQQDRIETLAMEARVALKRGLRDEARQSALEVWNYLRDRGTEGLGAPSSDFVCLADVLDTIELPGVALHEVIIAGYRDLMRQAAEIRDTAWRQSFLENVADNHEILERWKRIEETSDPGSSSS